MVICLEIATGGRRGRSKPCARTKKTATATAKVKNAGGQPFAVLRINLRYDGNNNGDGGADPSASLRARKREGETEKPQVFRAVRERPELHWAAPTCSRNLRLLGISFGRRGGFYFRDRNSAFR